MKTLLAIGFIAYVLVSIVYLGYLLGCKTRDRYIASCEAYIEALEDNRAALKELIATYESMEVVKDIIDLEPVLKPDGTVVYQMVES